MDDFNELNARRGLSPRQCRLLDLEAIVEETQYDDLQPWSARDSVGDPLPCADRKPELLMGVGAEKALELVRLLSGDSGRPTLEGVEAIEDDMKRAKLWRKLPAAVRDGVVKGSCAIAIHRMESGRIELVRLDTTWCEPVFVAQAGGKRARQLVAELQEAGVPLGLAPDGTLLAPVDADSHDLVMLRHEWVVDEEVSASAGGQPINTMRTRYRRDYLPNTIVDYEPVEVHAIDGVAVAFQALPVRPHGWGIVPVAWARSPYAQASDPDGPSFLRPSFQSIARKIDYVESQAGESVSKIAWPQLCIIDGKIWEVDVDESLGTPGRRSMPSGSGYVMRLKSAGAGGQQAKAEVIGPPADGPRVAAEFVERLHKRIEQITGLVDWDQAEAAGTLSGAALERMLQPQIATVGEWRVMVEELLETLCTKIGTILKRDVAPVLRWPRLAETTPQDLVASAQALTTANGGHPVVTRDTSARIFAQLADVPDVEKEIKALAKDAETALQEARDALQVARKKSDPKAVQTAGA